MFFLQRIKVNPEQNPLLISRAQVFSSYKM